MVSDALIFGSQQAKLLTDLYAFLPKQRYRRSELIQILSPKRGTVFESKVENTISIRRMQQRSSVDLSEQYKSEPTPFY